MRELFRYYSAGMPPLAPETPADTKCDLTNLQNHGGLQTLTLSYTFYLNYVNLDLIVQVFNSGILVTLYEIIHILAN